MRNVDRKYYVSGLNLKCLHKRGSNTQAYRKAWNGRAFKIWKNFEHFTALKYINILENSERRKYCPYLLIPTNETRFYELDSSSCRFMK